MKVHLKADNGKYVCAEVGAKDAPLCANREVPQSWETFELIPAGDEPPTLWRGFSDFRLAQAQMAGEDISGLLSSRRDLGANLVRVFGMKANNTGWALDPSGRPDYFGDVRRFLETAYSSGLNVEWTVFADTQTLMPDAARQQQFWHETCSTLQAYKDFVYMELCNEWNHPTQHLNPSLFDRPGGGLRASHGSGQTDADPVSPRWDYAAYHARRDGARGFTNYDPYEFQAVYPHHCPLIADEGAKPENYGFQAGYARLMGLHAACGWGGTFHTSEGVNSAPLSDAAAACARAFYAALGA